VDGSERNALLMNQSFFVALGLRGFGGGLEFELGALEGRCGGAPREDAVVRDLYHSAVDVSGSSGAAVGAAVCDGAPHSS